MYHLEDVDFSACLMSSTPDGLLESAKEPPDNSPERESTGSRCSNVAETTLSGCFQVTSGHKAGEAARNQSRR